MSELDTRWDHNGWRGPFPLPALAAALARKTAAGEARKRRQRKRQARYRDLHPQGYVFVARCAKGLKIGYSRNPWSRLRELRRSSPEAAMVSQYMTSRETYQEIREELRDSSIVGDWIRDGSAVTECIERLVRSSYVVAKSSSNVIASEPEPKIGVVAEPMIVVARSSEISAPAECKAELEVKSGNALRRYGKLGC